MMLILRWFSLKTADFAAITLEPCRLIRYEEKWEQIEKKLYLDFQEIKENSCIDLSYKITETDLKK